MTLEQDMLASLDGTFTIYAGAPELNQYDRVSRVSTAKAPPVDKSVTTIFEAILTLRPMLGEDLKVSLEEIKAAVSTYFDVPIREIISARRETRLVNCRMVYYWLARDLTLASFPMIGRHCGLRDHTTVISGIYNVKRFWGRYEAAIATLKMELGK